MSHQLLDEIESVFRLVNREIWIVTAAAGQRRGGLVATWVSQASIDRERPVVVVGIAPNHYTAELVNQGQAFALHLLSSDQVELALNFALGSGRDRDKLSGLDVSRSASGSPLIDSCLAWLDCAVFGRLDAGDRLYFWADVRAAKRNRQAAPLTEHDFFAAIDDQQKQALMRAALADIQCQRPMYDAWRNQLPTYLLPREPGSTAAS